jgi:hypothetical protein
LVPSKCSREVEIFSPINALALVVATRLDPQADAGAIRDEFNRDQKASIEVETVSADCINLLRGVRPSSKTLGGAS